MINRTRLQTLVALFLALPVPVVAQSDAPDLSIAVEIDTATGRFSAEAVLEAPQGNVVLPTADWLTIENVELLSDSGGRAVLVDPGALDPELHQNRDLRVSITGNLPAPQSPPAAVAWSEEATYSVGAEWFPVDGVEIRDHVITVTVPASQQVAATGTLMSDTDEGDMRETRYVFTGRSSDVGLFLGPYIRNVTTYGDHDLRTFFEEADAELSERYFEAIAQYLERYESEVGTYPYDGFSVVSAPIPVGLGFAGLTYVSQDILAHPYMTGRSLAHEILHSWWGNAVGVDYEGGNWAEGLTTFQADYALAEDSSDAAARDMRISWIRDLARLSDDEMLPLTAFRSSSHAGDQSEGYGKAALVFHMLRDEVGPQAFREGIRRFYAQNRNRIAGWPDLQAAFEEGAGRELGWFFDQWIARAGLPRLEIEAAELRKTADGTVVSLSIRQDAPSYRLRVPVVFDIPTGAERRIVELSGETETIDVLLAQRPSAVALDPDFDLARRPLEAELAPILRTFEGADTIQAVAASPFVSESDMLVSALYPATGEQQLTWQDGAAAHGDETEATLVAGLAGDVADLRPEHLGPEPAFAEQAATRLWIERDGDGHLWMFLSLEDAEDVEQDLRALRYYVGQSYIAFEDGRAVDGGVWEEGGSAGVIGFATSDD